MTAAFTQGYSTSSWTHPKGIYYRPNGIDINTTRWLPICRTGFSVCRNGKEIANGFPVVADTFQEVDKIYEKAGSSPLSKNIFPIPVFNKEERAQQQVNLSKTEFAQPAIGALSMGQYKTLQTAGFTPHLQQVIAFGELTALWAAGVYDDDTFLNLAKTRGEAMAIDNPNEDTGTMLAVKAPEQQVAEAIKNMSGVLIANVILKAK